MNKKELTKRAARPIYIGSRRYRYERRSLLDDLGRGCGAVGKGGYLDGQAFGL